MYSVVMPHFNKLVLTPVRGLWIRVLHRNKNNGIPGDAVKKLQFWLYSDFCCVDFFPMVVCVHWSNFLVQNREMENISRGPSPTFGNFVTIRTEGSMRDVSVARLQSTRIPYRHLSLLF
jgi:hypothetical protein